MLAARGLEVGKVRRRALSLERHEDILKLDVAVREAVAIASGLVRLTEGADPISLVLLARAQAAAGDAASGRASLERADALLRLAPAEVRDAIAPERAAAEASLAAPSVPATPPG